MLRLKRSKSSISDLAKLDADLDARSNAPSPTPQTSQRIRSKRGFSMGKLTATLGAHKKPARRSIDKASISRPIIDPRNPVIPPSPTTTLGEVSPPPSIFNLSSTSSSPRTSSIKSKRSVRSNSIHAHTDSEPSKFKLPSPSRPPPSIPATSSFDKRRSREDSPLTGILESPFELEHAFDCTYPCTPYRKLAKMEPTRLQPLGGGTKIRAIQQATEMQDLVAERAKRSGDEAPPYEFFELIGKGAYGRVFKGENRNTGSLVAIKILDIDKVDYEEMTTKNLSETLKEINILQQLRDSRARPFVNMIEEARPVHNELWIVSEYASGGSVNTLMKPTMNREHPGLEEKFIKPIARELATGLKYIHEAGVLHRDLKCNNILILEDGRVQLCDFGVSGMLEPEISKRSTIVGTPYWMAPELQKEWVKDADPHSRIQPNEILYGSEVDIWAYGCTVYEMATGFPPFHRTIQWDLPDSGVPILEGDEYSEELKDFVAFVLQPDPHNRPTPDEVLEHPFLANSVKMYPTVMLVKLVEDYYKWEHEGGARASLFNPYGAQAPDPLAPEDEDEDDDWTFSTSDEFENRLSRAFPNSFTAPGQPFTDIDAPPEEEDRFAKLQATFKEEAIDRGKKRLNRLFDPNTTPYRYSVIDDDGPGRPPSDLILRDFNPGAPNRETVIDLDFAAPVTSDIPSIDLGEVPTLKATRMKSLLREMALEDEERDAFDMDLVDKRATRDWEFPSNDEDVTKRATRDWKFPSGDDPLPKRATQDWKFPSGDDDLTKRATRDWKFPSSTEQPNRQTQEFKFPPKPNRATREWTFDAAMAEANYQAQRNSRRETRDWKFPTENAPPEKSRQTRDFHFPMGDPIESESESVPDQEQVLRSSPTLEPDFRFSLRHATTAPVGAFDDYPTLSSAPASPIRTSVINLDMANVDDDYRPSTAGSTSTTIHTAASESMNENPFNLEDQVQLSQNNNRASYHMKSQSEPNHAIAGLLTPQIYDEQGQPTNADPHHPSMHARGVSSVSQMQSQAKPPPKIVAGVYPRSNQRSQQFLWDGWSHSAAYGISSDDSPPASVTTDTSADDEDVDEAWDSLENLTFNRTKYVRSRRTDSRDEDPRSSDTDDNYTTDGAYDDLSRPIRVSLGPNGKPLVEFPVPRGPDAEALSGVDADPALLQSALWKSCLELRDGVRASRDLLKAMRLEDVRPLEGLSEREELGDGMATVRGSRT